MIRHHGDAPPGADATAEAAEIRRLRKKCALLQAEADLLRQLLRRHGIPCDFIPRHLADTPKVAPETGSVPGRAAGSVINGGGISSPEDPSPSTPGISPATGLSPSPSPSSPPSLFPSGSAERPSSGPRSPAIPDPAAVTRHTPEQHTQDPDAPARHSPAPAEHVPALDPAPSAALHSATVPATGSGAAAPPFPGTEEPPIQGAAAPAAPPRGNTLSATPEVPDPGSVSGDPAGDQGTLARLLRTGRGTAPAPAPRSFRGSPDSPLPPPPEMPPPPDSPFPEPRQIPGGTPGGSFPDHGIRAAAGSRIRITPEQLTLFREFFRGRPDVFALRGRPGKNGRAGYFPQCAGFWQDFCHRRKGTRIPCGECSFRKYLPPEATHFMAHLLGQRPDCTDVMGIYPLDAQEMCRLLVFDFDNHQEEGDGNGGEAVSDQELREEVATLRRICESAGLPALTERSRSGRGYHVWIFFEQDTPGRTARLFGQALLNRGAEELPLKNFRYYDRMLPEQDTLPPDRKHPGKKGIGNLIALPLQGRALEKGNSAFIGPDWQPLPDQWATLASTRKLAPDFIQKFIAEWGGAQVPGQDTAGDIKGGNRDPGDAGKAVPGNGDFLRPEDPDRARGSGGAGSSGRSRPLWEESTILRGEDLLISPLKIILRERIWLPLAVMRPRMQNALRRLAAFSNQEFHRRHRAGFATRGIPSVIFCGYDDGDFLSLPRGLLDLLEDRLRKAGIPRILEDQRTGGTPLPALVHTRKLLPEQEKAVSAMLRQEQGILAAATGFGKTVVAAEIIARLGISTLILISREALRKQWIRSLEEGLRRRDPVTADPIPGKGPGRGKAPKAGKAQDPYRITVGSLGAGTRALTGMIDVAMIQSVRGSMDTCPEFSFSSYGLVIADECHHLAAGTMDEVAARICSRHLYGLTATLSRSDGQERRIRLQLGPPLYSRSTREQITPGRIPHVIIPRFTGVTADGTLSLGDLLASLQEHPGRNRMILEDLRMCLEEGRCCLMLTKRTGHARLLFETAKTMTPHAFLLIGSAGRKENDRIRQALDQVPPDEPLVLISTDRYAGEGFDFPRLDTLLLCLPVSWKGSVIQSAGRLHRECPGKDRILIYDYADIGIRMLENMYLKRLKTYRSMGYTMECGRSGAQIGSMRSFFTAGDWEDTFARDLEQARQSVLLAVPEISPAPSSRLPGILKDLARRGIRTAIAPGIGRRGMAESGGLLREFRDAGIRIILGRSLRGQAAVIDGRIVWYGSICFLGDTPEDGTALRTADEEAAGELERLICPGGRKTPGRPDSSQMEMFPS